MMINTWYLLTLVLLVKLFTSISAICKSIQVEYIREKSIPLWDDYVSIIANSTSVSTFLCTRKLVPEEVSVIVEHGFFYEAEVSFKVLNDDLLVSETQQPITKDSCNICLLFLCYIQQLLLLVAVLHSSCWSVA